MTTEIKYIVIKNSRFTLFHLAIFILTFAAYSLFHASRKSFSNVKTTISDEWMSSCDEGVNESVCIPLKPDNIWNSRHFFTKSGEAKIFLGALDAAFLAAYSIGLFISGILGDRFNLRIVLFVGMILSAISMFMFGVVSEWLGIYNKVWYMFFWIINGFAQSTGWPAVVAVMGNWFGKSGRGLIFGIWSANASVGNILGALMVAAFLDYGYHYAFVITSSVLFAGGIVVLFGLIPSPKEIGLENTDADEITKSTAQEDQEQESGISHFDYEEPLLDNKETHVHKQKPIGFFTALFLPGVIMYSLCYACLKMINYSFFFWLPYYLSKNFGWQESVADQISIWYDVGGIFGGIIGGLISDIIGKRSVVIVTLLTLAIPSLYIFSASSDSKLMNAFLMTIVGYFVGGSANMISAAITADLGRQGPIQGNQEALSTVTGIVDGTGSIGAALGQILVPLIQDNFDWHYVFYLFIALCVLTNCCILPLFIRECKDLYNDRKNKRSQMSYTPINIDSDS